jgi:hypothetical protein
LRGKVEDPLTLARELRKGSIEQVLGINLAFNTSSAGSPLLMDMLSVDEAGDRQGRGKWRNCPL